MFIEQKTPVSCEELLKKYEENKTIKYGAQNIPIPLNAWIQLKQVDELDTRMRITIKTDMPAMFRMMIDKKMQAGLDQAVDMLCNIKY